MFVGNDTIRQGVMYAAAVFIPAAHPFNEQPSCFTAMLFPDPPDRIIMLQHGAAFGTRDGRSVTALT